LLAIHPQGGLVAARRDAAPDVLDLQADLLAGLPQVSDDEIG
jgi:hypothetical protein